MDFTDCFYIHVGSGGDSSKTVENNRITKKRILETVKDQPIKVEEGKNCMSFAELEEELSSYEIDRKISIWGDSKSAKIKKGCLVLLVSYKQTEYIGEVVFKISSPALSEELWGGQWKYQLGVKNVIKINIPNERLDTAKTGIKGYYHVLGITNKGKVQSSNCAKIGREEVTDRLWEYCIADRFNCVKKYIS